MSAVPQLLKLRRLAGLDRLWVAPDPLLSHDRQTAELLVARARLGLAMALAAAALLAQALDPQNRIITLWFGCAVGGAAYAGLALRAAQGGHAGESLPLLTSLGDALWVSASFAWLGAGAEQLPFLFAALLAVIGSTCVRPDPRVALSIGGVAIALYLVAAALATQATAGPTSPLAVFGVPPLVLAFTAAFALSAVLRADGLRRESTRDHLTGLLDRGYFEDRVRGEVVRAARAHQPFALVVVDVDHFKRFNDEHGHAAGDEVLRTVGASLRGAFRANDLVARYGGEEFVALLVGARIDQVVDRVEQMRDAIAALPIRLPGTGAEVSIRLSGGVAGYPDDGLTVEGVFAAADRRLYAAKDRGRNRVVGPAELPFPHLDTSASADSAG